MLDIMKCLGDNEGRTKMEHIKAKLTAYLLGLSGSVSVTCPLYFSPSHSFLLPNFPSVCYMSSLSPSRVLLLVPKVLLCVYSLYDISELIK